MQRIFFLNHIKKCSLPWIYFLVKQYKYQNKTMKPTICCGTSFHSLKPKIKYGFAWEKVSRKPNKVLFALTLTGLLEFLGLIEENEDSELIQILKKAELSYLKMEYDKSEQLFHFGLKIAQELRNENAETYIFDRLANVAFDNGHDEKAKKLFTEVLQRLLDKGMEKNNVIIIHISFKLAKIFENTKDYQTAELGYQYCFAGLEPILNEDIENHETIMLLYLMILNGYAYFNYNIGKLDKAYEFFNRAYELCIQLHGEVHEESVLLLNNLGTVSKQKGDVDSALNYFHKAEKIGKNLPSMKNFSYIYLNLGYLSMEKAILSDAKQYCTKALVNATRNEYEDGVKESKECLQKIKEFLTLRK